MATLSTTVSASEGFDFSLVSGAINVGDSFTLMPTKFAARNIAVRATVASDPRLIAAAMPLRTASDAVNSGNAQISAGATQVGFSAASIPVGGLTITYASGSGEFTIAPASAGFSVTAGGTTTAYAAGAPFAYASTGATITFAGMNFSISAARRTMVTLLPLRAINRVFPMAAMPSRLGNCRHKIRWLGVLQIIRWPTRVWSATSATKNHAKSR